MARPLPAPTLLRNPVQFVVRERHEPIEHGIVAFSPGLEKHGEIIRAPSQAIVCMRRFWHDLRFGLVESRTYHTPSWSRGNESASTNSSSCAGSCPKWNGTPSWKV